jgi:endonuclease/exonuclease/phosphatase family metal-dependent hydrolase
MIVRILQWNVLFRERADRILGVLAEADADVLCLQELTSVSGHNEGVDVPAFIAESLGFHSLYQIAQEWDAPGDRHTLGNGIFSRHPLARTDAVFVRPSQGINPHDPAQEGRAYVEADVSLPGGATLTVGTTHLSYVPHGVMTPEKKHEIDALLGIAKAKKERYVLTGDFNEQPASYTVQELSRTLRHCGPPFDVLTWPTRPFRSRDHVETELGWRIDYAFATPDLTVVDARAIDTDVSDHLPILVELEVSAAPTPGPGDPAASPEGSA